VGVGQCARCVAYPRMLANRSPLPPRSPSVARGVGHFATAAMPRFELPPSGRRLRIDPVLVRYMSAVLMRRSGMGSLAVGVGNNPDPVSLVRGANGCSWYAVPLRVIPALGQVSEYSFEPQAKVPWDVLQQRVTG